MPSRRVIIAAAVLLFALVGWDLSRPPGRQMAARTLLAGIDLYQATLSPFLGRAGARCRFEPTCSYFGEAAIRGHGALRGSWLALTRIARCGPWTPMGTIDPPPGVETLDQGTDELRDRGSDEAPDETQNEMQNEAPGERSGEASPALE